MIIMQMMGGLGNQMFQYALGRRLAMERGVLLKFDLKWYTKQEKRAFELNQFNINGDIATQEEIHNIRYLSDKLIIQGAFSIYQKIIPYWRRRYICEKDHRSFDFRVLQAPRHCVLKGYWHNEEYFSSIANLIKQDFTINKTLPVKIEKMKNEISSDADSVSVHIRRGDYVSETKLFHALPLEFYQTAINYVARKKKNPHFYFFSDEIDWVRKNINIEFPSTFVESSGSGPIDLILMKSCHSHINANSSFSWWGAWLGEDDEIVIVPNNWYKDLPFPKDRIPEHWICL